MLNFFILIVAFYKIMNDVSEKLQRLSELGLFCSAAIWGSTFFIVKDALQNVNPMILVGYRFIIAAIFSGLICIITKKSLTKNFVHGSLLGFLLWLLYISQTIGLSFTTASNSGFITGLFIIFVPLFSLIIFKRKPLLLDIIAVIFSLFGLWILTGGLTDINLGDLLTIITAITYSIHILLVDKYIREGENAFVLGFQQFLISGTISLFLSAIFGFQFLLGNTETVAVILFLAILPSFSAFIIQNLAQKWVKPVRVSLILALEPLFAALFAWTFGNELIVSHRLIGGLFIFLGLIISGISNRSTIPEMNLRLKKFK